MSDAQGSRVGTMFGPYRLTRLLGRGGMGEVYEAEHTVKEWTVAVKLMSENFSKDPVFRERMKREARITGRLQEPHVVPIHDYGEIDGQMFLEMRLIEGVDLDSRAQAVRSADPGACGGHHHPGRRGAGCRPCRRCDAPRHQTAEHLGHPRRLRLPGRLRHRQRHHRREAHPTGHRGGHLEIHGARTLLQRRGHLPRRHLRAGVRAARVPDRRSAIQRRQRHHAGHLPHDGAGPAAQRGAPGRPASV